MNTTGNIESDWGLAVCLTIAAIAAVYWYVIEPLWHMLHGRPF